MSDLIMMYCYYKDLSDEFSHWVDEDEKAMYNMYNTIAGYYKRLIEGGI